MGSGTFAAQWGQAPLRPFAGAKETGFYVAFQIFGSFLFLINAVNQLLMIL